MATVPRPPHQAKDAPRERDERWAIVAIVVLVAAYVVYRYRGGIDLPEFSFGRFRKIGTVLPYLGATLFSVLFQFWNRRRQAAVRANMEARLMREGPVRSAERVSVRQGRGRLQSFEADLYLTRAALYVFDAANKRDPQRIEVQSISEGAFIEDAMLEPNVGGAPPILRIAIGGARRQILELVSPDAAGWWVDVRRALGRSTDVEAELAGQEGPDGPSVGREYGSTTTV